MPPGPLILYCVLVVVASLIGGLLPGWMRLGHTRMQVMVSFVAGLMLGVALFHMLVHAAHHTHTLDTAVLWTVIGLLTMFFLIRTLDFHHHEPVHDPEEHEGHAHPIAPQSPLSWAGVAVGFALHTTIDGIALGASVRAESGHGDGIPGLGTFLAVLLHKPLDALAVVALMAAGGWSKRSRLLVNVGLAALCPLGALLFWWGAGAGSSVFVGSALAFSAGVFLCVSLADLLPELQFHSHDRLKLSVALLLGVALAYCLVFLEGDMHHGHAH